MGSKTLMLSKLVKDQRKKGKKAVERKTKKRIERSPAKWLGVEWKALYRNRFPGKDIEWTVTEAALAKKLIDEVGFDRALEMIRHFFYTWDMRKKAQKGAPGFKLFWAYRNTVQAELLGHAKVPESREYILGSGEYSEEVAKANPVLGWGEPEEEIDPYEKCDKDW